MSKHGINVPKGIAASSVEEAKEVARSVFPTRKRYNCQIPRLVYMLLQLKKFGQPSYNHVAAAKANLSYIGLDGVIGCMVNDDYKRKFLRCLTVVWVEHGDYNTNYRNISFIVSLLQLLYTFQMLTSIDKVKAILVNIFGGIRNAT
ncbi:CoA-ligase [Musa troglodytarum]|uniref:CoA-ligase n=1 Tax=Musa troglodytarum TaxID=320322 RepID=A0A9E7ETT1_9LILI|nr:CoA-ligase [Musa troglodytarum]